MSIRFSVRIPMEELPSPVDFIGEIGRLWMPEFGGEEKVQILPLMSNVALLICPELEELGEEVWQYDRSYCFYLSNISTRGLEVWYNDGSFIVRVLTLSCFEEWELAFQMLEFATGGENALIECNWPPNQLKLHDIRNEFGDEQIGSIIVGQLDQVFTTVAQDNQIVNLPGPIMGCDIGPIVVANLLSGHEDDDDPTGEMVETLFALMRLVNYVGVLPHFEHHEVPRMSKRQGAGGEELIAAAIEAGKAYLIPEVDFLVFTDRNGSTVSLPASKIRDELGKFFRQPDELMFFDEFMIALGPIDIKRYSEFVDGIKSASSPLPVRWINNGVKSALNLIRP